MSENKEFTNEELETIIDSLFLLTKIKTGKELGELVRLIGKSSLMIKGREMDDSRSFDMDNCPFRNEIPNGEYCKDEPREEDNEAKS